MVFDTLHPKLTNILKKYGYISPTKIQKVAIPLILRRLNTLIVAPTGSGKTEAALFPVYSMILENSTKGINALYITPLRALNRDILRRMKNLAEEIGLSVAVRHGDTTESERRRLSLHPPHILITTPETLQFLLVGKRLRASLRKLRWVIVDELHELIDDKRGVQLSLALERLKEISENRIQRIGLSATIGDIQLAKKVLGGINSLVYDINVEEIKKLDIQIAYPKPSHNDEKLSLEIGAPPDAIARAKLLLKILETHKGILIFTNTRDLAERLAARLKVVAQDDSIVFVHHGSLSREERIYVESEFKKGNIKAIVCTSSLELGIDIGHIDLVVQYMSPRQAIKLAQRIGRAGHRIEKISRGIILTVDDDDLFESIVLARRAIAGNYESPTIPLKSYDVLAHQIIGLLIEYREISIDDIYKIVSRSVYYSGLSRNELNRLIDFLQDLEYIKKFGEKYLKGRRGIYEYYFEHASTIPDVRKYKVRDLASGKFIGELDEEYVAGFCEEGYDFILAGKVWRIEHIDEASGLIEVTPSETATGAVPSWIGEMIPVSYKAAREVGALRRLISQYISLNNNKIKNKIKTQYRINDKIFNDLVNYIKKQIDSGHIVPDDKTIYIEYSSDTAVVHGCFGSRVNNTLAILLSEYISMKKSSSVKHYSDPYRIMIYSPSGLDEKDIREALFLDRSKAQKIILSAIKKSTVFRIKFLHVARRFGIIKRDASLKSLRKLIEIYDNTPLSEEALKEALLSKFDLDNTLYVLDLIKRNKIKIVYKHVKGASFSPIAQGILKSYIRYEHSFEVIPSKAVLEIVKNRLLNKKINLMCLHCLKWYTTFRVKSLPDKIICPVCKSSIIAIVPGNISSAIAVAKKARARKKLSEEEKSILNYLQKSALLYLSYGKRAALVLAGRGVGVTTATRILSSSLTEEDIIRKVIDAERKYIKTRMFWDS